MNSISFIAALTSIRQIVLQGSLNAETATAFYNLVEQAFDELPNHGTLIIRGDKGIFSHENKEPIVSGGVRDITSDGIAALIRAIKLAKNKGMNLSIVVPQPGIRNELMNAGIPEKVLH